MCFLFNFKICLHNISHNISFYFRPDIEFSRCIKNNIFTDKMLCRRNVQSFDEVGIFTNLREDIFYFSVDWTICTDNFNR